MPLRMRRVRRRAAATEERTHGPHAGELLGQIFLGEDPKYALRRATDPAFATPAEAAAARLLLLELERRERFDLDVRIALAERGIAA